MVRFLKYERDIRRMILRNYFAERYNLWRQTAWGLVHLFLISCVTLYKILPLYKIDKYNLHRLPHRDILTLNEILYISSQCLTHNRYLTIVALFSLLSKEEKHLINIFLGKYPRPKFCLCGPGFYNPVLASVHADFAEGLPVHTQTQ